jgi:hypothetical protein
VSPGRKSLSTFALIVWLLQRKSWTLQINSVIHPTPSLMRDPGPANWGAPMQERRTPAYPKPPQWVATMRRIPAAARQPPATNIRKLCHLLAPRAAISDATSHTRELETSCVRDRDDHWLCPLLSVRLNFFTKASNKDGGAMRQRRVTRAIATNRSRIGPPRGPIDSRTNSGMPIRVWRRHPRVARIL